MGECSSFCVGSCGTDNLQHNPAHPPFALPGEPGNIDYSYPEGFSRTNFSEAAAAASQSASATGSSEQSSSMTSYLRTSPTPGARNINYPPYVVNNVQEGHDLAVHAISPNATHIDGVQEYDVHNLNGHQILNVTYHGLLNVFPDKRPFILGRATFAGSGRYAAHWGGDNVSKWSHMFLSISQALSFSLFGIPMFGTDTCGFSGNTDEELCNRWMQLSAFFPFYCNHNVIGSIPQEPYRWTSVMSASKKVMTIRYAILPLHLHPLPPSPHNRLNCPVRPSLGIPHRPNPRPHQHAVPPRPLANGTPHPRTKRLIRKRRLPGPRARPTLVRLVHADRRQCKTRREHHYPRTPGPHPPLPPRRVRHPHARTSPNHPRRPQHELGHPGRVEF